MIGDLIGDWLAGAVGWNSRAAFYERRRRRKLARAYAEGRPLEFPGSVIGKAPYCHPSGGLLRIDGTSVTWRPVPGTPLYPFPVERLTVRDVEAGLPPVTFPWALTDAVVCDDAGTVVRVEVLRVDLPYLALVLPGITPWLTPRPPDEPLRRERLPRW